VKRDRAFWVIVGILCMAMGVALLIGNHRCTVSGGHYVRGLFSYECVRR